MKLGNIVWSVLLLLFGIKLLGSPLLNSLLNSHVNMQMDYRWLPSIGLFVFAVIVCLAKIKANARGMESKDAPNDKPDERENPGKESLRSLDELLRREHFRRHRNKEE